MGEAFTSWVRWPDRNTLPKRARPGVYAIAISADDLTGIPFSWREDIAYIGMTNSQRGLAGRLRQFDRTINSKEGHGGACRVRYVHRDYDVLVERMYVAVRAFDCDVTSRKPDQLRTKGEVAREEYECFARYAEAFGDLPHFNRPEAPKLTAKDLRSR